ncbi:protein inturned isoform X2 [Tachysurus ichikawai]
MQNTLKLTAGLENTLFHYVLMETVQGIFITPTHRELSLLGGFIHPQLICNIYHCCLSICHIFQQSLPSPDQRELGSAEQRHSKLPKLWMSEVEQQLEREMFEQNERFVAMKRQVS